MLVEAILFHTNTHHNAIINLPMDWNVPGLQGALVLCLVYRVLWYRAWFIGCSGIVPGLQGALVSCLVYRVLWYCAWFIGCSGILPGL